MPGWIIEMGANRERCPRCGEWAELPEGTFEVVEDAIRVLAASNLTRERLSRLQTILEAAQEGRISVEAAEQAVEEEAPELASLLQRLRPRMGRALIVFLVAVLQILGGEVLAELRDNSATKADVEQAVEMAMQACQVQPAPPPIRPGPQPP
jgi:hypothetical protein